MRTKLKVFRVLQKLSQDEMSAVLGYGHAYYGHVERGTQKGSARFWLQLQKAFALTDKQVKELQEID